MHKRQFRTGSELEKRPNEKYKRALPTIDEQKVVLDF